MKRFWIIFITEVKSWRQDPITSLGGIIPPFIILIAFGIMFASRPTLKMAIINHDEGMYGDILRRSVEETISPFGVPYYDISSLPEAEAWQAYESYHLDAVWVIPANFSQRILAGSSPQIETYFSNYIDDLAKNHRIYQAEVLWTFYEKSAMPAPPLSIREEYPLPEMVDWLEIIGVGIALLSFILGGMMNIQILTYKEHVAKITLEFGLSPRSLAWVLLPKIILALLASLVTGTLFMGILYLWSGIWAGRFILNVWLLSGLVSLFWIMAVLVVGLRARNFMGAAIGVILTGVTAFFIGGGLAMVRNNEANVPWFSWLLPNTHAIDTLRDFMLFNTFSPDWGKCLAVVSSFAVVALAGGIGYASYQLRRSQ